MKRILALVLVAGVAAAVARGDEATERTYKMKCKMCHGADGKGLDAEAAAKRKLDPAKLSLAAMKDKSVDENVKIVTDGHEKMPAFAEKLTAEEIKALVDYSLTLVSAEAAPAAEPAP